MRIIYPHKISSEILDVIFEAREQLVIVSPYVDFWTRISNDLKAAVQRGVKIDFYTRLDSNNSGSWEQIEGLDIKPRLVPNLHAKLYFNEQFGVISSMNLLSTSNNSSIEIGCKTDTPEELKELNNFVNTFVVPYETDERPDESDIYLSKAKFSEALANYTGTKVFYRDGMFNIKTERDTFFLSIDKLYNRVNITAILSGKQAEMYPSTFSKFNHSQYFECILIVGQGKHYNQVLATSAKKLSNSFLDKLMVREKKELIHEISALITIISEFKKANN
ncbi:MAG: hypothetical protein K0S09_845 [Sphingobacteriaceae bacterium]|jgi:hypothetical protein|nr:hypothetical protein [Sphingobacteriaceae bacterium]